MTERRSNGSREDSFKRMFRWFMVAVLVVIEIALLWKMIISDSPTTALLLAIVLIVALLFSYWSAVVRHSRLVDRNRRAKGANTRCRAKG